MSQLKYFIAPAVVMVFILMGIAVTAKANPSFYPGSAVYNTATSTGRYMTPGAATTTLVYDAYSISGTNQPASGNTYAVNSAALLLQFSASTTASVLGVRFEYSQDGIDWYGDGAVNLTATTTAYNVSINENFTWTFASSTIGGIRADQGLAGINGTKNRDNKIINIVTPTRFVRAIVTLTGANATVWGQIVPLKEQN